MDLERIEKSTGFETINIIRNSQIRLLIFGQK